jgi:hypothetical protein
MQVFQLVKILPIYCEPENLLLGSQEFATGPYLHSIETSSHIHTLLFKINFNIILPRMPESHMWSLLFRVLH